MYMLYCHILSYSATCGPCCFVYLDANVIFSGVTARHSSILLMNKFGEGTSGAVCLCNIYTLTVQDMPPKHWPQSDCLLRLLLQRIIQQWISNVGEEEECDSLPRSRPRLGLGLVFCVLWKEVIYSPPYRHPAMVTCWEAPKKKTMCNIWELLQGCRGNWHNSWPFGKAFSRPQ